MQGEPQTFDEFVGQDMIKTELGAMAVVGDNRSVLLRGNYGSGKTTIAKIYASKRGDYTYREVPRDLDDFDSRATTHIIDEIHLLRQQEKIYHLFDNLTFVFCTTEREELSAPFLSRCVELQLEPYTTDDLYVILFYRAEREQIEIDDHSIKILASRSRGTPRTAVQLLRRVSTLARANDITLNPRFVANMLNNLRIYKEGLTEDDISYLNTLWEANGPVSLNTMGAVLNRSKRYIQDTVESFLLYKHYITVTREGRRLTEYGKEFTETLRRNNARL